MPVLTARDFRCYFVFSSSDHVVARPKGKACVRQSRIVE